MVAWIRDLSMEVDDTGTWQPCICCYNNRRSVDPCSLKSLTQETPEYNACMVVHIYLAYAHIQGRVYVKNFANNVQCHHIKLLIFPWRTGRLVEKPCDFKDLSAASEEEEGDEKADGALT